MPNHRAPAPVQRQNADLEEAAGILKAGLTKLTGFFGQPQRPGKDQIAAFLDKEIAPYFDFSYMAQWAAGPMYRRMGEQRQKAMETDIKTRFLTTMAQKLTSFNNQSVSYLPPRQSSAKQVELSITIGNRGSYPARLDFRLYKSSNGWKVYDVSANGSSALMYYRQYYRQQMRQAPMPRFPR